MKRLHQRMMAYIAGGVIGAALAAAGCWHAPSAHTISRNYSFGDFPVDPPSDCEDGKFDDLVRGGQLFKYYCGTCHNARALGERPFSNYHVALTHMREQAYLTGKEYRELMHFLRRWQDVGPPTPDVEPSPKRFIYSRPIPELRPQKSKPTESDAESPRGDKHKSPSSDPPDVIWYPPKTGATP